MFDLPVKRILWKECRTQANVWGSLLAGAVLLQLLFLVLGKDFQQGFAQYPLEVAFVLTVCYAVTSAAILFAGEKEESTDQWLRQLPLDTWRLFIGKFTFTVISVLAYAAIVLASGAIIKGLAPFGTGAISPTWWERTYSFAQGSIGLVLWAVFFSLILTRVMAVLLATVATQLLLAAVAGNFLPGRFEYWMLGAGFCVLLADIWLTRNWLSGRSVVTAFEGNRSAAGRRSQFWLRGITRAAVRTPLSARTSGALVWRELRGAVPFAIAWSAMGLLMVLLMGYVWAGSGTNFVFLFSTPLVCGLMTCAGDNWQSTYRFLSDRGISSRTVWRTKHVVWFSLAFGLVLLFGGIDFLLHGGRESLTGHPSTWELLADPVHLHRYESTSSLFANEMRWRHISLVGSLILSFYVVGHLCSLWFRRVVVSGSIAFVTMVIILTWHLVMVGLDVSFAWAIWPLTITLIVASVISIDGWLLEHSGWRTKLKHALWVAVPVVVVMFGAIWYRATQIPRVALGFDYYRDNQLVERRVDRALTSQWKEALVFLKNNFSPYLPQFAADEQQWLEQDLGMTPPAEPDAANETGNDAGGAAGGLQASPDLESAAYGAMAGYGVMESSSGGDAHDPWQDSVLDMSIEQLMKLETQVAGNNPPRIDTLGWDDQLPFPGRRLMVIGPVIAAKAHQQTIAGDLDAAWQTLVAGLKLTKYLERQVVTAMDLTGVWQARQVVLREIHAWAAAPSQTPEQLQQALETLEQLDSALVGLSEFRQRRFAFLRRHIESAGNSNPWMIEDAAPGLLHRLVWPTERQRILRLMTVIEAGYSSSVRHQAPQLTDGYAWPWVSPEITSEHIQRWASTTPLLPSEYVHDSTIDIRPVVATALATRLVLMLQIHRIEHGAFPKALYDLEGQVPRDPLTGGEFGYAPGGFDVPAVAAMGGGFNDEFFIPADTPLLWSPGENRPEPKLDGELIILQPVEFGDHSRYVELAIAAEKLFAGRRSESDSPRRLLFVFVGHRPW